MPVSTTPGDCSSCEPCDICGCDEAEAWSPATDPDVFNWWTLADESSLTLTGDTPPRISSIANQVMGGLALTPFGTTTSRRVTFDPAQLMPNGMKGAHLASTQSWLQATGHPNYAKPWSVFGAVSVVGAMSGSLYGFPAPSTNFAGVLWESTASPGVRYLTSDYTVEQVALSAGLVNPSFNIIGVHFNTPPAQSWVRLNGVQVGAAALAQDPYWQNNILIIGMNQLFAEAVMISGVPDAAKVAAIEAYFAQWGP